MGSEVFSVRDCALIPIATGYRAHNMSELRDRLALVHPASIYLHFWAGRLGPQFDLREYQNDFAHWAAISLHDQTLAEKLGIINPQDYCDMEDLRQVLVDTLEERIVQRDANPWDRADYPFYFTRSKIIVFDTSHKIKHPRELVAILQNITRSSLFYHFIDSRIRTEEKSDDFSLWIASFGPKYQPLVDEFHRIDPYFIPLHILRSKLLFAMTRFFVQAGCEAQEEAL